MSDTPKPRSLEELSAQLDREQDRTMLALDACGAGIWDWDMISDRLFWGIGMRKLFGVEHFGGTYADFERCLEESDAVLVRAQLQFAVESGSIFDMSFKLASRPGIIVRGRGKCYYSDGSPTRFVGVNVQEPSSRPAFCPTAYPECPSHPALMARAI